ncbi:hypothetical protein [Kutzneria kofuensis]|uniref:Uncharacterized protein n=1 Tax=Kutzneria kofuensis TaxID=103725 RepID=A0A7W9KQD4_9PSEU|nr:hypothetical protein [Kutzneria kofuensis]MBB5896712.1 hypothetical protein [Kutzneria kofuensis]
MGVSRYLGSTKNIAGCAGGLVGLGLHLAGVGGDYWLGVVAALYAAGALAAPPERVRLMPPQPAEEAEALLRGLDALVARVRGLGNRMPAEAVERLDRIAEVLCGLLARPAELSAYPDTLHAVARIAATDLPLTVQTFLNMPWWYAVTRRVASEPSAAEQLLTQLDLLEQEAKRLAEEFYDADSRRQADHTRYLEGRARRDDK